MKLIEASKFKKRSTIKPNRMRINQQLRIKINYREKKDNKINKIRISKTQIKRIFKV
jgi:hypothetical protein